MTDLRLFLRRTARRPLLPALATAVLTLGVAAGAAVFGVGYAVLVRPLPYPAPDDLMVITSAFPNAQLRAMGLSGPEAVELGQLTTCFTELGFGYGTAVPVSAGNLTSGADAAYVSAGLLRALAPPLIAGRLFTADEDRPGDPSRVVIGEDFWRRVLSAQPDVVGRTILVNGRASEVIGIAGARAALDGRPADVWLPLQYDVRSSASNRANHAFTVIGRRAPGTGLAALGRNIDAAMARWGAATGQFHVPDAKFHPLTITPLVDTVRGPARRAIIVLIAGVVLVLIIAASNAATLLIASGDTRQMEMTIRAVLGARPSTLLRLHATDALIVCAISAVAGGGLAAAVSRMVIGLAPLELRRLGLALPAWQIVAIAAGVAAVASVACIAALSFRMTGATSHSALAADGRNSTATPDRQRLRRLLVSVQIAFALALSSGALAMTESFWKLAHVDLGFDPSHAVHASLTLPAAGYASPELIDAFYDRVLDRLSGAPGLVAAGAVTGLPPMRRPNNSSFQFDGQSSDPHTGAPPVQFVQFASPGALAALGLSLRAGRFFSDSDRAGSEPVAIVNERAARVYFGDTSPLGRRLHPFGRGIPWMTIVGVVGDVRQGGADRESGAEVFMPASQARVADAVIMARDREIVVRTAGADSAPAAIAIRAAVLAADPSVAITAVGPMDDVVGGSIASTRFLTTVLGAFAAIALLLCTSGVYGVVAQAIDMRVREIGVRRSLGASARAIVGLVSKQAAGLVTTGVAVGLVSAAAAGRALAPFVYLTPTFDAGRLAVVAASVAIAATIACLLPLRLALTIDPAIALRR